MKKNKDELVKNKEYKKLVKNIMKTKELDVLRAYFYIGNLKSNTELIVNFEKDYCYLNITEFYYKENDWTDEIELCEEKVNYKDLLETIKKYI